MEAAEDSAAPGPDAPPAVAPAPPERAGAFSTMMDAQKRQKAADAAYAKEPLPKPKPRGPAPKGLDGQPKTWDPPAGPIEQHATHGPGIFTGRWASPTDASPMPAPAPNFRPREGTTWTTPTSASTSPTTSASSGTPEDWKKELKTFKWRGKRLAHVFEGGWATGKYIKKATIRESPNNEAGFYVFYYADVGQHLAHNLGLEEHGDTRSWLILKQAELARLA